MGSSSQQQEVAWLVLLYSLHFHNAGYQIQLLYDIQLKFLKPSMDLKTLKQEKII